MPDLSQYVYTEKEATNSVWVTVSMAMIFLMQAGFALVENGSVRQKNSSNILIKNLFDACFGSLSYWLIGFGFAYGLKDGNQFIGLDLDYFAASGFETHKKDLYLNYIFQFSFAATSATIVSGSMAERAQLTAYIGFSILMTAFVYPVVVAWIWGGGWLQQNGFVDFAGTTGVHLVGGVAGFCAAMILGPRYGQNGRQIERPEDVVGYKEILELYPEEERHLFRKWFLKRANADVMRPSNVPFIVVGIFMLWVSWLFFNGGSTTDMFAPRHQNAPKIIMNTILAGAPAGLVSQYFKHKYVQTEDYYDVTGLCNGILAGLVAITGVCHDVKPWLAFIIGGVGGFFYVIGCKVAQKLKVDDPIEACMVHGFGGVWGTLAAGLFNESHGLLMGAYSQRDSPVTADFRLRAFGYQVAGLLAVTVWTAFWASAYFLILKRYDKLRVDLVDEILGLDIAEMGEPLPIFVQELQMEKLNIQRKETYRTLGRALGLNHHGAKKETLQERMASLGFEESSLNSLSHQISKQNINSQGSRSKLQSIRPDQDQFEMQFNNQDGPPVDRMSLNASTEKNSDRN